MTQLAPQIAIDIFRRMALIRQTEETIARRYSEGKMRCPVHLCSGQEAVAAAVCAVLRKDDFAVSGHRAHGHYLAKGGNLNAMIAEIYGKVTGCAAGKGGSMHLIDENVGFMGSTAIVGGTIPVGVGLALSIQLEKTNRISCVFLGDGSTEEGVFYESLNFAAIRKLPVLFVCENNLYSVYSPLRVRQPAERRIYSLASAIGVQGDFGDGNDPIDVYQKTLAAVDAMRSGIGPRLLEFSTYRWREHCGPNFDNDIGYRTPEEYEYWLKLDPIPRMKAHLANTGILSESEACCIETEIQQAVDEAFTYSESSPFPEPCDAFTHAYA